MARAVLLSSVTLLCPTQRVAIFGSVFASSNSLGTWAVCITTLETSSSAVAKRQHDASCLSVVSTNSTKRRVESFIVSYIGITACSKMRRSVVFGVTLRLLVINILSSSPAINTAAYYQQYVTT